MRLTRTHRPGLVEELHRSHRIVLGVLASVLVLSLATSGYLIGYAQPRMSRYVELTREVRDVHEGMLDQQTGLQAWLATGRGEFRERATEGDREAERATAELVRDMQQSPDVTDSVLRMLLARQRWQAWANQAADMRVSPSQRGGKALEAFIERGRRLFDAYRLEQQTSVDAARQHRREAASRQNLTLVVVLLLYLTLLGAAGTVSVRRRRRLRAEILDPVKDLRETIARLSDGDLSARAAPTSVPELAEIGSALDRLATDLSRAKAERTSRERRLAKLAYRFETVVRVSREIAGSLSVQYVSATVTSAAAELLNTSTVLWLRGDSQELEAVHRTSAPHGDAAPRSDPDPPAIVARAAADGAVIADDTSRAYPLVLAGMVTAVLEVAGSTVDPDTELVLNALLSTAAASLESAHLHRTTRELADLDGLTRLPNRRRFEVDAATEWERCRRYDRPLSLVMMDLDHFKRLNDEHGHLLGDQVLREVAQAVRQVLRSTDTAYRYGGEELVVLLRETGLEGASVAADRLRQAVAALTVADHPWVSVTTSAGVSTRHPGMAHHTALVAEADAALYEAKHQGRNRVVTTGLRTETLFHGAANEPEAASGAMLETPSEAPAGTRDFAPPERLLEGWSPGDPTS